MKLYLVQHGEACAKEVDPGRPLTEQGRLDIDRMAIFLKQANITVDRVMHSGKLRAKQTAERLANVIAAEVELETRELINPNDNPEAFYRQSESWDHDTLIVSHLPFLARLVSHLVCDTENLLIVAYTPGSIACLEHVDGASWQINWMIRPELLG